MTRSAENRACVPRVVHIVERQPAKDVLRHLAYLSAHPDLADHANQDVYALDLETPEATPLEADIIVSHLTLAGRALSDVVTLKTRNPGVPILHVEHHHSRALSRLDAPTWQRTQGILRSAYRLFDTVIAVSHGQSRWMLDQNLVSFDHLAVIAPCVDLTPLRTTPAPGRVIRTIGAIGDFEHKAGFDMLIDVVRSLPIADMRLDLFGDGSQRAQWVERAGDTPRIRFFDPPRNRADIIAQCDIIAVPSRWDAFNSLALEARAARRPVLVSPVDGLLDQVAIGAIPAAEVSTDAWRDVLLDVMFTDPTHHTRVVPMHKPEDTMIAAWRDVLLSVDRTAARHPSHSEHQRDRKKDGLT